MKKKKKKYQEPVLYVVGHKKSCCGTCDEPGSGDATCGGPGLDASDCGSPGESAVGAFCWADGNSAAGICNDVGNSAAA